MRFSPHRTVPNNSLDDIDPGYDSLSDDEYTEDGPMGLIDSSPLKSVLTPSKTPTNEHLNRKDLRKTYQVYSSSPLARSDLTPSKQVSSEPNQKDESENVDDLSELLKDLKFKERYMMAVESLRSTRLSSRPGSRPKSRHHSARHTRRSSLAEPLTSPILGNTKSSHFNTESTVSSQLPATKSAGDSYFEQREHDILNDLESRSSRRAKEVAEQIEAIEIERKHQESERKRREEEERRRIEEEKRRIEEERKRQEEEERKRKIEEERKHKEVEQKAKEEAERSKREKEAAEKRFFEEKKQKEEEEAQRKKIQEEQDAKRGKGITNYGEVEKTFLHYKKLIETINKDIVGQVKSDLTTKNAILKHKRKINPKFGQLTNSMSQLARIGNEVITLITETKSNELAFKWIMNFVAKAIVAQAETEVRAAPASALPLGKLALNLLVEFPELKEFVMARFVKKCPFVIGYTCAIDTVEGRLRMGWKRDDGDKFESEVTYDERMSGMMTLYSVITRLPLDAKYYNTHEHPLPISNGWILLARLVNQPKNLLTNAHFIITASWWEASAHELVQVYGKQGNKMLSLLWTTWAQSSNDQNFSGAKTLQTIGEDWSQSGKINKFDEMEP